MRFLTLGLIGSVAAISAGCSTTRPPAPPAWPIHELRAAQTIALTLPDASNFDASALLLMPDGDLLTLRDADATLYRVQIHAGTATADLLPLTNYFTAAALAPFTRDKHGRYDCEGLARDDQGRLYICEEADRWILRCDPASGRVERLAIDWSPVQKFFSPDRNASFEGVAVGGGRLYVANERQSPVILVVDLATLKIVDHFVVTPRTGSLLGILHYSDLSWSNGRLYVLCRQHRVVLEVEPKSHAVLAEYNYRALEEELGYSGLLPVGLMEGLAVEREFLWLVTDNNGLCHGPGGQDKRPTLLQCPRPAR